jgi:Na+-driven multidrug efflux pump
VSYDYSNRSSLSAIKPNPSNPNANPNANPNLNLTVGDLILVCGLGQGIVGAAYATMFSQFGSAIYLLWASISKINATSSTSPAINTTEKEDANVSNSNSNSNSNRDEEIKTGRTYKYSDESSRDKRKSEKVIKKQKQKENLINLVQYPGYKDFKQFLSFCGPLFFVLLTKAFSWSYTTYACSTAGPVGLAAHQIVLNIFCLFAIFGDAISQTAQTYLPPFLSARNMTKKLFNDGKTTINNIMKTAFAAGFFNSIFAFFVVTKYGQKVRG